MGTIDGRSDARFAAVRDAFAENFAANGEVGAACAVVVDGDAVVDVWGGHAYPDGPEWGPDTIVETRSTTKGPAALCLHVLADRGLIDLDDPVRRHWPELRADPSIRHALTHSAGIPVIDAELPAGAILDWDLVAAAIAVQEPLWEAGAKTGYHGVTFGWMIGQIVRQVTGTTLGRYLREAITGPLGVDYFIGTPASEHPRIAPLLAPPPAREGEQQTPTFLETLDPSSLAGRMYAPVLPPIAPWPNTPAFRSAEIPGVNGIGTARALAGMYGELARGGGQLVGADTVETMGAEAVAGVDAVLGIDVRRTLGFELPATWADDGRPAHAFGATGAGGSLAFADPEAGIGFAYVMNQLWPGGIGRRDPRAASLIRATYNSLAS